MFDLKFWQEIKEKYPEIKEKLDEFYDYQKLNSEYCFCDLEKFFDEWGIIILPLYYLSRNPKDETWYDDWGYEIILKNGNKFRVMNLNTRFEFELEATKKAFEIAKEMENKK